MSSISVDGLAIKFIVQEGIARSSFCGFFPSLLLGSCRDVEQSDAPSPGKTYILVAFFITGPLLFTNPSLGEGSGVSPDLKTGNQSSQV